MFLKVFIFCALNIGLISANPLLQQLLQLQGWPNLPNQANPLNLGPAGYGKPNYGPQNFANLLPPGCQNSMAAFTQAHGHAPQKEQNAQFACNKLNPAMSNQLNQLIYDKVIGNPTLQSFLNPNARINQHQIPVQSHHTPTHPVQKPKTDSSSVVNNYIILPAEFLDNDILSQKGKCGGKIEKKRGSRNGRKRKPASQNSCNSFENKPNMTANPGNKEDRTFAIPKTPETQHAELIDFNQCPCNPGVPCNQLKGAINMEQYLKPYQNVLNYNPLMKSEPYTQLPEKQMNNNLATPQNPIKKVQPSLETTNKLKQTNKQTQEEVLANTLHQKFPTVPDSMVKSFMSFLKNQSPNKGPKMNRALSPYHQYSNYPLNYNNMFPTQQPYNLNKSTMKKPKRVNQTKNHRKQTKPEHPNQKDKKLVLDKQTVILNIKTLDNNTKPIIITSEDDFKKYIENYHKAAEEKKIKSEDLFDSSEEQDDIHITKPPVAPDVEYIETEKKEYIKNENMELSTHSGMIADYYPNFNDEITNLAKEEINYNTHYNNPVENSENMEELNRERRKYDRHSAEENKISRINDSKRNYYKVYQPTELNIETTTADNQNFLETSSRIPMEKKVDEIQFRTPPGLTIVDFETKKIDKEYIKPNYDINYLPNNYKETSRYEELDGPYYNIHKNSDNDVETVFARSQVIQYGKPEENASVYEDASREEISEESDEINYTIDGDTMFVIAKPGNANKHW